MSFLHLPRPAPSLPANEAAQLSPKKSPRSHSNAFSNIISHLAFEHDSLNRKVRIPKISRPRPISAQSHDSQTYLLDTPRLKTPPISREESAKTHSTIMSHFTLPTLDPTSSKPTPKISFAKPSSPTSRSISRPKSTFQPPSKTAEKPEYPIYPSAQTRYVDMLLGLDSVPRSHNLLAAFSTWILLAGFIVVPGTFASIDHSKQLQQSAKNNKLEHAVLDSVKHASLMVVAGLCCAIGGSGMIWLWWRWRQNYVWLINKIFLAGLLNSLAGLISTLINVYSQQGGHFSITARVTVAATATCTLVTAVLYLLYNFWMLERVRNKHEKEVELEAGKRATFYQLADDDSHE